MKLFIYTIFTSFLSLFVSETNVPVKNPAPEAIENCNFSTIVNEPIGLRPIPKPIILQTNTEITGFKSFSMLAPSISATKVDAQVGIDVGPAGFTPGDTIEYTIVINNSGSMDATNTQFTDNLDVNTTLVPNSLQCSPIAINDSYNVFGNVQISVPAVSGLLVNDQNPCSNGSLTVTAVNTAGTQGNVTFNADGSFTFNPAAGFNGSTSFDYTLSNGVFTNTGTVTLTVSGRIWFIDNNGSNGDGRLGSPFNTIANFNTATSGGSVGDIIFLYRQTAANYSGAALTLKNNQYLIGQGASSSIVSITGITLPPHSLALPSTGGTNPVISHVNTAVILASGNQLHGFDVSNSGGVSGIFGNNFGTLKIRNLSVANAGGTAFSVTNGVLDVIIKKLDSSSSNNPGLLISSTTGSFLVEGTGTTGGSGGVIDALGNRGVDIQNATNITLKNMNFTRTSTASGGACDNTANNLSCRAAIYLVNVTTVVLDNIYVYNTNNQGLNGNNIGGLTITNSRFTNCGNEQFEGAVKLRELYGTCSITNSEFDDAFDETVEIFNSTTPNSLNLNVINSIFRDNFDNGGAKGIFIKTENAVTNTVNIDECDFLRLGTQGVFVNPKAGTMNVNVTDCLFDRDTKKYMDGAHVIPEGSATANINILRNTLDVASGSGLLVQGYGNSVFQARVNQNVIVGPNTCSDCVLGGDMESPSCNCFGDGIVVWATNNSSGKAEVVGNNISGIDYSGRGVYANARDEADLNILIQNNIIAIAGDSWYAIDVTAGNTSAGQTSSVCAFVTGNTTSVSGVGPQTFFAHFRVRATTLNTAAGVGTTSIINLQGSGNTAAKIWRNNINTPDTTAMPPGIVSSSTSGMGTEQINFNQSCNLTLTHPTALENPFTAVSDNPAGLVQGGTQTPETPQTDPIEVDNTKPGNIGETEEALKMMDMVSVGPFTLPATRSMTIKFKARINDMLPKFLCQVSNQGTVSGSNFSNVLTDDPAAGGMTDPTLSVFPTLTIGDLVYKDNNKNGVFDGGDAGVNSVAVNLYADNGDNVLTAADGAAIATTSTLGGGFYSFAVCPGDYIVEIDPANFLSSGALYDNGLMAPLISSPVGGATDPDDDVNDDDNGDPVASFGVASQAITLDFGAEPIDDNDADANTNLSLDFGFKTPTTVSINEVTLAEGTGGSTTSFDFTITRNDNSEAFDVTVNTADGTATSADNDYAAISGGTVSFTAGGNLTETVTVLVNHDNKVEAIETFNVLLSGAPAGVIITDGSGEGTINNDDNATVTLTSVNATENEGNVGVFTDFTFKATLNNPVQGGFMLAFSTDDGSAMVVGNDYVDGDGTLTFAGTAGEEQSITVQVKVDNIVESDETFTVALGSISGTSPVQSAAITKTGSPQTGTILNDDNATITLVPLAAGASVSEGAPGPPLFTFNNFEAHLSAPVQGGFDLAFSVTDGTATTADNDYAVLTLSPIFYTGNANEFKTITIQIPRDDKVETNETFTVALTDITNTTAPSGSLTIVSSPQTATILNDDQTILTLTAHDANKNEGNTGTTPFTFRATLGNPVQGGFTIDYETNEGTATLADMDFTDNDNSLTFTGAANEFHDITVLVNGDIVVEANETFEVALTDLSLLSVDPSDILISFSPRTGNILNDEVDFGDAPDTYATFLASNGARHNTLLGYHLGTNIDGDADGQPDATAQGDDTDAEGDDEDGVFFTGSFIKGQSATITFAPTAAGYIDGFFDFNNNGNFTDSGEKFMNSVPIDPSSNTFTFIVPAGATEATTFARFRFSSDGGLSYDGLATNGEVEDYQVQIINTLLSIDNVAMTEGNSSTKTFTFMVSLNNPAGAGGVTFDIATQNNTATSGSGDYVAKSLTGQTIPQGQMMYTFDVTVNGDQLVELTESFFVNVTNVTGAGVLDGQGIGTIQNEDAAVMTISNPTVTEGNSGTVVATFDLELDYPSDANVLVNFQTMDGSATTADLDYQSDISSRTFNPGVLLSGVNVLVNGDCAIEMIEDFIVRLSSLDPNGRNITFSGGGSTLDGTATIENDDDLPVINCPADYSQNTDAGSCSAIVTLTLPSPSGICGMSTLEFRHRTVDDMNNPTGPYSSWILAANNTQSFAKGKHQVEWRITDGSGSSTCSHYLTVIDDEDPMPICKNITVTLNSNGQASITATDVFDGGTDNCGTVIPLSVTPNTFDCSDVGANTVTLTVHDSNGNTATCQATVTIVGGGTPDVPTNITSTVLTATSVLIDWDDVANADRYQVRYRVQGTTTWTNTGNLFVSEATLAGLNANHIYQYQVRSRCGNSVNSAWSATMTFFTSTCTVPSGLAVSNITANSALATWSPVGVAISYMIRYRKIGQGWTVTSSSTTFKTLTGLLAATNYEVQVASFCSGGAGAWSPSVYFTTASSKKAGTVVNHVKIDAGHGRVIDWSLFPNPAKSGQGLTLQLTNSMSEASTILIHDMQGRQVYRLQWDIEAGSNMVYLNDLWLHNGLYFVTIRLNKQMLTKRLIIN